MLVCKPHAGYFKNFTVNVCHGVSMLQSPLMQAKVRVHRHILFYRGAFRTIQRLDVFLTLKRLQWLTNTAGSCSLILASRGSAALLYSLLRSSQEDGGANRSRLS